MAKPSPEDIRARYPVDSYLSLNYWPAETPEDRLQLEQAILFWAEEMEKRKFSEAVKWFTNIANYHSQPFIHFDYSFATNRLNIITPQNGPAGSKDVVAPDTVVNLLKEPYLVNVSVFTGNRPYPKITPVNDEPESEDAALVNTAILEALWEDPLRMQERLRQIVGSILLTGTAAIETVYGNVGAFNQIEDETLVDDPKALMGKKRVKSTELVPVKEVQVNTYDAFNILVNPSATSNPDTLSWVMLNSYQDKGYIKELFNVKGDSRYFPDALDSMNPDVTSNNALYWKRRVMQILDSPDWVNSAWSGNAQGSADPNGMNPNEVVYRVIDCKPNHLYPRGRTLIMAGSKLIFASDSRAWMDKYPKRWTTVRFFRYATDPNRFWGDALLSPLIRPQKRVNSIFRMLQDYRKSVFIGTILWPDSVRSPNDSLSGLPRQIFRYRPGPKGEKPELLRNGNFPPEILNELDRCIAYIERTSGINRIMGGDSPPPNVRAGIMLDFQERKALESRDAIFQAFEETLEQVATDILDEVTYHYDEDQLQDLMRRVSAASSSVSSLAFDNIKQMDLRDNTLVRFDIRSKMKHSPEAREEKLIQVIQYGNNLRTMPPEERRIFFNAIGLPEFNTAIENLHINKARRMISRIRQATSPEEVNDVVGTASPEVDNGPIMAEQFQKAQLKDSWLDMPPFQKDGITALFDPRWTSEKRPYVDVSKAAIGGRPGEVSSTASRPPSARSRQFGFASSSART